MVDTDRLAPRRAGAGERQMATYYEATIHERGNGFAGVGDYVRESITGDLYRVVELCGPIHTGQAGAPNYVHAVVESADWADVDDDYEPLCSVEITGDADDLRATDHELM
jgi:hypothetical protein